MIHDEERSARELGTTLRTAGLAGQTRVEGAGVHWHVDLTGPDRRIRVHCLWYDAGHGDLHLGMNPANARARGPSPPPPRVGAEYLVVLFEVDQRIAGGRTRSADDAVAAARAWVDRRLPLDAVQREVPFVGARRRRLQKLQDQLAGPAGPGPAARCVIEQEIGYELWAYGDGRSCELRPGPEDTSSVTCTFYQGQAALAAGLLTGPVAAAARAWIFERCTLRDLVRRHPGVEAQPHAEVLEAGDAQRWHWLHVADRLADPRDVLGPLKPLIDLLLQRPAVTRFFSFTSLMRLCFSASSHFPWVTDGLPIVWSEPDGIVVEIDDSRTLCPLERARDLIEGALVACPVRPFVGSAPFLLVDPLAAELARQGSPMRPRLQQRRQWYDVIVSSEDRSCVVSGEAPCGVQFAGPAAWAQAAWPTLAEATTAIRGWLEDRVTLEELASSPGAPGFSARALAFDPD